MSLLAKLKGSVPPKSTGPGVGRGRSKSRSPAFGRGDKLRSASGGSNRSGEGSMSRSRSGSPGSRSGSGSDSGSGSGSGSGSDYSDDEDHGPPSKKPIKRPSTATTRTKSSTTSATRQRSRSRDTSQTRRPKGNRQTERDLISGAAGVALSAPKKKVMAGVANPRLESERAARALAESKLKKMEVAEKARKARERHATTGGRPASAHPLSATTGLTSPTKSANPSSTFYQTTANVPGQAESPPRSHKTVAPVPPLPPCTCNSSGCRAEFKVLYDTLAAHIETQALAASQMADLRRENTFLRKQLQLYRMEGIPRNYNETALGGGAAAILASPELAHTASLSKLGRPPSASNLHSTAGSVGFNLEADSTAAQRRRDRERERERRMEEVKQNVLDRDDDEQDLWKPVNSSSSNHATAAQSQPSLQRGLSRSCGGTLLPRQSSLTKNDSFLAVANDGDDDEPRFQSPPSLTSPNRLRSFGGVGSERLDLNASGSSSNGGVLAGLTRTPSGRHIDPFGHTSNNPLAASQLHHTGTHDRKSSKVDLWHDDRQDDLVGDLNPPKSSVAPSSSSSATAFDRRPTALDREPSMAFTQEFVVNTQY